MSSSNTGKICPACGEGFKIIFYQRRAADEPPDKVVYCPNCPLDTSRLSFTPPVKDDIQRRTAGRQNSISIRSTRSTSSVNSYRSISGKHSSVSPFEKQGYTWCIRIEGNAASRCYKEAINNNSIFTSILSTTVVLNEANSKKILHVHNNFIFPGKGFILLNTARIAPFVYLDQKSIYVQKNPSREKDIVLVQAYGTELERVGESQYTILQTLKDGKQPCILIYLYATSALAMYPESICMDILHEVLVRYGTESSIKSFIDPQTINTLFVQSSKAYDWPSAPDSGYVYTWKPDGERFWYIKYGSVWLFCRRLLSGRIVGFKIGKNLEYADKPGPIPDTEVMVGFPPILIDLLVSDNGATTPFSRSLETVLEGFNNSKRIDVPIHIREYYKSEKELLQTKDILQYPVDGAVGIKDGSMTTIKLKDTKSIELELKENGDLVSSEGTRVATSELQNTYRPGSIIEIRFTKQSGYDRPTITESLLRTDKIKANSYEVCNTIMTTISNAPDALARRVVVQWCSSIRQKINSIAAKITGKGRIVLDIGAGDGQAVSDYSIDEDTTYVLIEPDEAKCKKLLRRVAEPGKGRSRLFIGAEHITKAVGLASNKTLKYAIICATIGDVLKQQYCIRTLKSAVRCCTASFSISHIAPELQTLALEGIDVIGCGYMYDEAKRSSILVNESGVLMKLTNPNDPKDRNAIVMWGNDRTYNEYAIVLDDFKQVFHTKLAKSLVPIASGHEISLLNTVSTKIYIISTKRYI